MTIISEFIKKAISYPSKAALVSDLEGTMTYKELNERSNHIAEVISKTDNPSDYIGIMLNRSFDMIAALLGIMKAGKAYVSIDPTYPSDRINYMLSKSNISLVVCNAEYARILNDNYNTLLIEQNKGFSFQNVDLSFDKGIACVIFSSGSTGKPNGAKMSHSALLNNLMWFIEYYKLDEFDVDLQVPSISYTSSVEDIFSTLLSGGTLVMLDENKILNARYFYNMIDKYRVTHFIMVPSLYKEFLRIVKCGLTLRFVILAGEPLTRKLVQIHFQKIPNIRLVMEYGMAETCATCFVKEIIDHNSYLCIGKPINNTEFFVYSPDSEGVGELYICGKGLFSGYINDIEMTKKKITYEKQKKYLKTGDYVQINNEDVIFCGRKDKQIKVNGKRVDLSEVDYVLQTLESVDESITIPIIYQDRQFIVSLIKTKPKKMACEGYLDYLYSNLPSQFIPDHIVIIDSLVYLPNKKVDINTMKAIAFNNLEERIMKTTDTYKRILKLVSEVTKGTLNDPKTDEDLRLQGLDSLNYIELLARLEEEFDFEFGYDDVIDYKTATIKVLYDYITSLKK